MKKIIIVGVLLLVVGGVYYKFFYNRPVPHSGYVGQQLSEDKVEELCMMSGKHMKTFPDTCADHCSEIKEGERACGEMLTRSCECGPDKCWNGSECVSNPSE